VLRRARGYEGGGSQGGQTPLRTVFLGTPAFAVPTLERLVERGHPVVAVFTQPDRPKGRGGQVTASPVKEAALRLGIEIHQPERIRRPASVDLLRELAPDAMVVVGYGQIIPQSILDIPRLGILNVHASLLPKYRGAAPIQWAIANGETVTGVTIMRIDAGLDTGDILSSWESPIGAEETAIELGERLAVAGAGLLVQSLDEFAAGRIQPQPQDHALATLAPILKKEDARIDWSWPAPRIQCRARGFQPWPGVATTFRGQAMQIWSCSVADCAAAGPPGSIHPGKRRLLVSCGDGSTLELLEVQLAGKKRVTAEAFLNGHRVEDNELLGEREL
jgi:methionyl-tRNA formyltransferase